MKTLITVSIVLLFSFTSKGDVDPKGLPVDLVNIEVNNKSPNESACTQIAGGIEDKLVNFNIFSADKADEFKEWDSLDNNTFCWEGPVPMEDCAMGNCMGGEDFCNGGCTTVDGCTICYPCYFNGSP